MCFYARKPATVFVAQEDIICYKVLNKHYNKGEYESTYQGYIYKHNVINPVVPLIERPHPDRIDLVCIDAGYHSYTSLKIAREHASYNNYRVVVRCIIPKGAKYMFDPSWNHEEYVSNQIILKRLV